MLVLKMKFTIFVLAFLIGLARCATNDTALIEDKINGTTNSTEDSESNSSSLEDSNEYLPNPFLESRFGRRFPSDQFRSRMGPTPFNLGPQISSYPSFYPPTQSLPLSRDPQNNNIGYGPQSIPYRSLNFGPPPPPLGLVPPPSSSYNSQFPSGLLQGIPPEVLRDFNDEYQSRSSRGIFDNIDSGTALALQHFQKSIEAVLDDARVQINRLQNRVLCINQWTPVQRGDENLAPCLLRAAQNTSTCFEPHIQMIRMKSESLAELGRRTASEIYACSTRPNPLACIRSALFNAQIQSQPTIQKIVYSLSYASQCLPIITNQSIGCLNESLINNLSNSRDLYGHIIKCLTK